MIAATASHSPTLDAGHDNAASAQALTSMIREILGADAVTPAAEPMLVRLTELLRVQMRLGRAGAAGAPLWSATFNDPIVSRALRFVHADPARRWTVDDLARKAGTSRTVLTERFKVAIGQPPIAYVTAWRMQLAAERIRDRNGSLAAIAAEIGYESEAAFNRAFKRVTGVTPGRWRDGVAFPSPAS